MVQPVKSKRLYPHIVGVENEEPGQLERLTPTHKNILEALEKAKGGLGIPHCMHLYGSYCDRRVPDLLKYQEKLKKRYLVRPMSQRPWAFDKYKSGMHPLQHKAQLVFLNSKAPTTKSFTAWDMAYRLADIFTVFEKALQPQWINYDWMNGPTMRIGREGKRRTFRADRLCKVGELLLPIEDDSGTETGTDPNKGGDTIPGKVRLYNEYVNSGRLWEEYGTDRMQVLFVTPRVDKVVSLLREAKDTPNRFLVADVSEFSQLVPLSGINWKNVLGKPATLSV